MHTCTAAGFVFLSCLTVCFCNCGILNHKGTEFLFGVPQNGVANNRMPMVELYMTNMNPTPATTRITTPSYSSWFDPFPINRVIEPYGRGVYAFLQTDLAPSGTRSNKLGVRIVSDIDILVQVSNTGDKTSDGFLVYPKLYLGYSYMVASYAESSGNIAPSVESLQGPYQLLVTSTTDNALVRVRFQFCTDPLALVTMYAEQNYYCGDTLSVSLNAYYNLQIQSGLDLSGTVVECDYPISVVSGVYWGSVGSAAFVDHMADMILPMDTLGSEYLVPPVQYGDGYALKIIGTAQGTSVSIVYSDGTTDSFTIDTSTGWTTFKPTSTFGHIQATQPIMALQFTMYDSTANLGDASMTLLRPKCNSGSSTSAIISLPYYLAAAGDIDFVENIDIVALVAKEDISNVRVYGLVENGAIQDSCVSLTVINSDVLDYAVVYIPWNGDKSTVLRGRLNTNIFVYVRGVMYGEAHSTTGGYVGSQFNELDSVQTYCGDIQTTPALQATTEVMTTLNVAVESTVQTTTELVATTEAAVKTTTELVATTEAAVKTTTELVTTTEAAVKSTTELVATTEAAVKSTTELVATTEAAEQTTTELVATTEAAEQTTTELVATTEAAVKSTTELVDTTEAAVKSTTELVDTTEAAVKSTTELVDTTEAAVKSTTELVDSTSVTSSVSTSTDSFLSMITSDLNTISWPNLNTTTVSTNTEATTTENDTENTTKKYVFESYQVADLEEVQRPVESPIARELGGSCVIFVLIFIFIIIIIDTPHLYRHVKMFIHNVKSFFHTPSLRRRKMSDMLDLTNPETL